MHSSTQSNKWRGSHLCTATASLHLVIFYVAMKSSACHMVNASALLQIYSLLVSGWPIQGVLLGVALFCSGDIYWTAWCSLTLCFWGLHYSFGQCQIASFQMKYHWLQVRELCDTVDLLVSHLNLYSRCRSPVPHLLYTTLLVTIIVFGIIYGDRQSNHDQLPRCTCEEPPQHLLCWWWGTHYPWTIAQWL